MMEVQQYIKGESLERLASEIGLTRKQVKIWFCNHTLQCKTVHSDRVCLDDGMHESAQ